MKCDEARFAVAADPSDASPDLAAHLASCESCSEHAQEMRVLDSRIRRALTVPVPDRLPESKPIRLAATEPRTAFARPLAMAAGFGAVAILAGVLWIGVPRETLADAVVGHMDHEPESWTSTLPLPLADVAEVLAQSGVALSGPMADVTYANSCWFRGRYVPHLVVRTQAGPVTVMVLPRERVRTRTAFDEDGYRGVLVPAQRGAVAVITRDEANVDAVADKALAAITFEP